MTRRIFSLLCLLPLVAIAAACHAQLPVTPLTIPVTATAPSNCTASGAAACTYPVSRAQVASGTTSSNCPAVTGTTNYTPLTASESDTTPSFTDSTVASATTYCYTMQVVQSGITGPAAAAVAATSASGAGQVTNLAATSDAAEVVRDEGKTYQLARAGDAWVAVSGATRRD